MEKLSFDFPQGLAGEVFRVPYDEVAVKAREAAKKFGWRSAASDGSRTELVLIDVQNTFCLPEFELFVGGSTGTAAVEDNQRLTGFIYNNIAAISGITATMDSHSAFQIFHPAFFVDPNGDHPAPFTDIHTEDLQSGRWSFNPVIADQFGITPEHGQARAIHYAKKLADKGKYALTIWPYHAMLGGIGHALVSVVEQALFFHSIARNAPMDVLIKGRSAFTENYSALSPEVLFDQEDATLGSPDDTIFQKLKNCDRMIITGQAKSHCVSWTVSDLLARIKIENPSLAEKVYLLEDCTSPVVIPGVVDHTDYANSAFNEFFVSGMNSIHSNAILGS